MFLAATLVLLMARHGLRVTEAVDLNWDQLDFTKGHLHVRRLKNGINPVHPTQGDELVPDGQTFATAEPYVQVADCVSS